MKSLIWSIVMMTAPGLAAEQLESGRSAGIPQQDVEHAQQRIEHVINDDRVVVITDVEFVPFSQYLGLPDVNRLPPTSAGNPKPAQHRMP